MITKLYSILIVIKELKRPFRSPSLSHYRNALKRIARHDDQDCSKESILNMMDKFVKTVSVMDDTILIPSRLMDREVRTMNQSLKSLHYLGT